MAEQTHSIRFHLSPFAIGHLAGSRVQAVPLREVIDQAYCANTGDIILDFKKVEVTQSFMDEVIGRLILTYGPDILSRLVFKNCSEDVQAIITFVASDRSDQYIKQHSH